MKRHRFFVDSSVTSFRSLSTYNEYEGVNLITSLNSIQGLLANALFNSSYYPVALKQIKAPFVSPSSNSVPGDLDLILFRPGNSKEAIAFEVKSVTAKDLGDGYPKVNRHGSLAKGVKQANAYLKFGFSQVYYLILILDDSQMNTELNQLFRQTDLVEVNTFLHSNDFARLHDEVGVIFLRITQSVNQPVERCGGAHLLVAREAEVRSQRDDCTGKLISIIESRS